MGRGQLPENDILGGDGEIPLLDADRLSDHEGDLAPESASSATYGSPEDDKAVSSIKNKLRSLASFASKSEEEIENSAIEMYNRSCEQVAAGCDDEQLSKIAALFSENPKELRERLMKDREPDALAGSEGGAAALLRALRD